MLRFGCDRIFQSEQGKAPSSAELDAIIDRSGSRAAAAAVKEQEEEAAAAGEGEGGQHCVWQAAREASPTPASSTSPSHPAHARLPLA